MLRQLRRALTISVRKFPASKVVPFMRRMPNNSRVEEPALDDIDDLRQRPIRFRAQMRYRRAVRFGGLRGYGAVLTEAPNVLECEQTLGLPTGTYGDALNRTCDFMAAWLSARF